MSTQRSETITGADGSFDAHLEIPDSGSGPAILVIQEIFGVNAYIRDVCARVAAMGYVALAPDMFWRLEPGFRVEPDQGEDGMNAAFAKMGAYDFATAGQDLGDALAHLRGLPETTGGAAVMGFCFGGTLTFHAAADLDPTCAISYYGSGVADALEAKASKVTAPTLFHFGDNDPYLPNEDSQKVIDAYEGADHVQVLVQPGAGHAFDNHHNPMFSNPDAAAAAWAATTDFLGLHLPVN